MIDLYTFATGNGQRASIALEECGLPYRTHKVDIGRGEQHAPQFRRLNPLGRIPVIVDSEGPGGRTVTLSQSGAILLYCAEKSGQFLPSDPIERIAALEWMILAVSDGAEAFGGIFRLSRLPEKPDAAIGVYQKRLGKLFDDLNSHLADRRYLVSDISVADLALYTVVLQGAQFESLAARPHLRHWLDLMSARPGVIRGMGVPA
jgi:GSH-dependent disulfide-bond oxidoreductase